MYTGVRMHSLCRATGSPYLSSSMFYFVAHLWQFLEEIRASIWRRFVTHGGRLICELVRAYSLVLHP